MIFGDDESDPLNILLYDLVSCNTTSALAATDFLTIAHESQDLESCFSDLTVQTTSLASEYPSLHIYLVDLIGSIMHSKPANFPSAMRASFIKVFSIGLGDLTQSNYGHLYEAEQRRRNTRLGEEHIYLNRFIARLLSALGEPEEPKEGLTHVQDALFIVSTALEDHAASHKVPDVDVPAAAQYLIHSGKLVFGECKKGSVHFLVFISHCPLPPLIHFLNFCTRIKKSAFPQKENTKTE